uniref:Uncharacterized protein n=1 Tax=Arundo donax TaxID=35708 RepID=A0A0A9GTW0_ARUDO
MLFFIHIFKIYELRPLHFWGSTKISNFVIHKKPLPLPFWGICFMIYVFSHFVDI